MSTFNLKYEHARLLFFAAWAKYKNHDELSDMEHNALKVILLHPEHHYMFEEPDKYLHREYPSSEPKDNPFLHMSLHLVIEEQLVIDQPPGIREQFEQILAKFKSRHETLHVILDCLAEVMWWSQRSETPPDGDVYLECLKLRQD